MRVLIELKETSQPLVYQAQNTYTKGPLFCLFLEDKGVAKIPLANIWRIKEERK